MKINTLHKWHLTPAEARAIQKNLSAWVVRTGQCKQPKFVARIELLPMIGDMSDGSEQAIVTLKKMATHTILERKVAIKRSTFPRLDGLLSFRKAPAILAALEKLSRTPDLLVCDGRGVTGPDSFGVASHIGLLANLPTIGIRPPKPRDSYSCLGPERGCWLPVETQQQSSLIVRILPGMDPLLVSPAHRIDAASAIANILQLFPANMPSREYLSLLYPERYQHAESHPPLLRVVKD